MHVVYRETPGSEPAWHSYSYPNGIYAAGYTLEDLRDQFRDALAFERSDAWESVISEHIERRAADGVFLRVAVDRRTLDREYLRAALQTGFDQPAGHCPELAGEYVAATGDFVVICCVASDTLGWVYEQMDDHDAVHVAMAVSEVGVWHTVVAGSAAATPDPARVENLADLGLPTSPTIGELAAALSTTASGTGMGPVLVSTRG